MERVWKFSGKPSVIDLLITRVTATKNKDLRELSDAEVDALLRRKDDDAAD